MASIRHLGMLNCLFNFRLRQHITPSFYSIDSPSWHCIAGPEFAAYVTHEAKTLMYFSIQFSPSRKKSGQQSTEDDLEKDAPPLAYWRVLLFKAG